MKRIYLDYAATTPVDPVVLAAMKPYFSEKYGNAGSLHSFGQEAMAAVDNSREKIAKAIGADFREIIFTGSATEANNLALRGIVKSFYKKYPRAKSRIIVSSIEHESVSRTAHDLGVDGVEIAYLPVNKDGLVDLKKIKTVLNKRTVLVSIMYANNEIGTVQPIVEINRLISEFREQENKESGRGIDCVYPLFHTDAAQALQYLDCDVNKLGVDLMTLSAHKIYGPKGIGLLYQKDLGPAHKFLEPVIAGGGQEFGLRSGTENVSLIVGFAKAVEIETRDKKQETRRIAGLRDYFWKQIKKIYPKAQLNGPDIKKFRINSEHSDVFVGSDRLPNNLNIYFPGHKAEDLLIKLDLAGITVSAGSACSARGNEPSHVLKACGFSLERIKSSLRITLGRPTTKVEIDEAIARMRKIFVDTN
jgi:cysteine desulfurase